MEENNGYPHALFMYVAKIVDESLTLELTFGSSHLLWQWICVFYV